MTLRNCFITRDCASGCHWSPSAETSAVDLRALVRSEADQWHAEARF